MKNLSSKNKLERGKSVEKLQHFSFRKLNSGLLVSAAIGAFFIVNNGTAQAATTQNGDAVSAVTNQNAESDKLKQNEVTLSATATAPSNGATASEDKAATDSTPTASATASDAASATATDANTEANVTLDNTQVGNVEGNRNINLTISGKAGTYVINVPSSDVYDVVASSANVTKSGNTYTVVYDGTEKAPVITIKTKSNYAAQPAPLADLGTTEKTITWSVDGQDQKPVTFTQTIKPEWNPKSPVQVSPDPKTVKEIPANTDVTYSFKVTETPGVNTFVEPENNNASYASPRVNNAANYGTTITIPVPANFTLNEAATKAANDFKDQTTITQVGGTGHDIVITVPKGSGSQYWQHTYPQYYGKDLDLGYQIVGSYNTEDPNNDLIFSVDNPIKIVQKLGDAADAPTKVANVADDATAVVHFIDDTTGKELSTITLSGKAGAVVDLSSANQQLEDYLNNQGYILASSDLPTSETKFDLKKDNGENGPTQVWTVHLTRPAQSWPDTTSTTTPVVQPQPEENPAPAKDAEKPASEKPAKGEETSSTQGNETSQQNLAQTSTRISAAQLPQTGEHDTKATSVLGLAAVLVASLFGFGLKKKRED